MKSDPELNALITQLEELAGDSPYSLEAYQFAMDAVWSYWRTWQIYGTALEDDFFCEFVHDYALKRFGDKTLSELASRSIRSGKDVGGIYLRLIDADLVPGDRENIVAYFENGLAFENAFKRLKRPEIFGNYFQWRVSTLLFVTTVAAFAVVGTNRLGMKGGLATLFAAWIMGMGLFSVASGARNRSKGWQLNVALGCVLLVLGIVLFYALIN